ncbi:protein-tyrosine phosphatase [Anaerobranca californiensis DSM 14826]|uniref:protein-tyrosine-phosphatase n=1 Tax=Anaerobranca californiensis DSM 14826 TaxID=1120989 RepID=A0A1M6RX88_9FIRM|nr:CpsB/CapC family capsule biosynthesis tyrosine phosphatase [Anaerobranca californiensis]SHK36938.1 protein-tyrosine phosphatase [Anaerobranca californiensis DSM 14826]
MVLVDTHNHLLPGIDDGAKNIEETIEMCKIAADDGIKKIVATPHYIKGELETEPSVIKGLVGEVNKLLQKQGIDIEILPGHEVFVDPAIPQLLKDNLLCTINNSKYLLIELPMGSTPKYIEELIYSIRLNGYVPIIAHPERNVEIMENPNLLYRFIELGAMAQLTTWSIQGNYGKKVQETAEILLKHDMYSLIGTDAHSPTKRRPKLEKGINLVQQIVGIERANLLMKNAELIIENTEVNNLLPKKIQRQKGLFSFIKKIVNK